MMLSQICRIERRMSNFGRLACALAVTSVLTAAAVRVGAQEPTPAPDTSGNTPRSAMRGYLTASRAADYTRAATYLDLRSLPPAQRSNGPELAKELHVVLDRTLWVELDSLSDDPDGATDDGLPPRRDLVGTIWGPSARVEVYLDRVGGAGLPPWQVAGSTVRQIPKLYQDFGYGRLTELLPAPFFDVRFLDVQLWQWIGLVVLALAAAIVAWVATAVTARALRVVLLRSRLAFEEPHLPLAVGPLRLLAAAALFDAGTGLLALPVPAYRVVTGIADALVVFAVVWLLWRIADVFARAAERRFASEGKPAAAGLVPIGRRTVKVLLTAVAMIAVLENFGFNVTGILAALGVGGLAVALAAQKTVENLFGGITLIADQPVRVGDLCRFGDRTGTVEDIGLRSTRLRTPERTVVSVPNGQFASMELENFARRDRIRLQATLALRYETTPAQVRAVLTAISKLLLGNPKVAPDSAYARFVGFGATSLDIEVVAYVATAETSEFLAVREDLFLGMMDAVATSGTAFAAAKVPPPTVAAPQPPPRPPPTDGGAQR